MELLLKLIRAHDQHVEMGNFRSRRDYSDLCKFIQCLDSNNPLDVSDDRLHSLSSGIVVTDSDKVTCYQAELVGEHVIEAMDGLTYDGVSVKKASRVRTLSQVSITVVAAAGKTCNLDSGLLFSRLLVIMQRLQVL